MRLNFLEGALSTKSQVAAFQERKNVASIVVILPSPCRTSPFFAITLKRIPKIVADLLKGMPVTQRRRDRVTLSAKKPLAPGERRETVTKVPAPELDFSDPWFLLMTAPRAEERVSAKLLDAGCQVFWPHEFHRVEYGGKRKPLEFRRGTYPGYLLMAGDLRGVSSIFDIDGVTSVVGTSSGWATVPAGVVKAMADYQSEEVIPHLEIVPSETDPPLITAGEKVRVLSGPFMAFMATMVESIGMDRAKVAIDLMGRETFVEIDVAQLEAA